MNIVFRTDASTELGIGHVMRCLALASVLQQQGASIRFVCRLLPEYLYAMITARGHDLTLLPAECHALNTDAIHTAAACQHTAWLIVDHYELDRHWETQLRPYTRSIAVIDDLANRPHDCDLLLDQNPRAADAYTHLIPPHTTVLIGPRYALLRPEFAIQRRQCTRQFDAVQRIFICFGGSDPAGMTLTVLTALTQLTALNATLDVVIGRMNPQRVAIEQACQHAAQSINLYCDADNIAELMAAADLAIGAGGITTWERCCLGLPSVVITIADNQLLTARHLAHAGAHLFLGNAADITIERIKTVIAGICQVPTLLASLAAQSRLLVDGRGANYVANHLQVHHGNLQLRRATIDDRDIVYAWRNDPAVRRYSFHQSPIAWPEHCHWYAAVLDSPDCIILIGAYAQEPVGIVRYDLHDTTAVVSIYLAPHHIGQGYGNQLLIMANQWLAQHYPDITVIEASIRATNHQSIKSFQVAAFAPHHVVYHHTIQRQSVCNSLITT